jgi:SAM-dependent methyltransferase
MNSPDRYCGGELELFAQARHWKDYLRAQIAPHLSGRVLEVGAGLGGTTKVLAGLPHAEWLCLEPDAVLAAAIRRDVAAGALPPVEVAVGTLAALPAGRLFDTILYIDVLEHIEDDRGELAAAAARLAPGGRLVVLSPAHAMLFSDFDRAVGHCRRYARDSLRAAAPPGLKLARLRYLDGVGMLASLANRWLLRKSLPSAADIALWDRVMVPLSRRVDPLLGYRLGKSVLAVWVASH